MWFFIITCSALNPCPTQVSSSYATKSACEAYALKANFSVRDSRRKVSSCMKGK